MTEFDRFLVWLRGANRRTLENLVQFLVGAFIEAQEDSVEVGWKQVKAMMWRAEKK